MQFTPTSQNTFGNHAAPNDPGRMYERSQQGKGYLFGIPKDERKRTQSPMVTGTSILALAHATGVTLACDTLGSYGSLGRFRDFRRMKKVNDHCMIAASGDLSDFQYICDMLDELVLENDFEGDGIAIQPKEVFSYLSRVMYNRRNKFDPLWNYVIVAGWQDGKPFLAQVDLIGTNYEERIIATGYGLDICTPLLRNALEKNPGLGQEEARKVVESSMKVLQYRECRTTNNIQFAEVGSDGVTIHEPAPLETDWSIGRFYGD